MTNPAKGILVAGAMLAIAAPLMAQPGGLAMLRGLTKGEWTVKYRDGTPPKRICLKSGEELIQLRHDQAGCSRFVVEDDAAKVVVHYTCPGDGYGRTNIRRETSSLVQLDSQGIASGLPYQVSAEARRTGTC